LPFPVLTSNTRHLVQLVVPRQAEDCEDNDHDPTEPAPTAD
jgi:hypothetical protein